MEKPDTPELDRRHEIIEKAHVLTEFVDWLNDERGLVIAEYQKFDEYEDEGLVPARFGGYERLFAEFFDIDLNKIAQEQAVLLDYLRATDA